MIAAITGSILIFTVIIIYILLFSGFPVGEYVMGGQNKILPKEKKALIFVAIVIQIFLIIVLMQTGLVIDVGIPDTVTRILSWIFAIYITINVIMNFLSRSKKERYLMTPLSLITAICYWLTILYSLK